MADETEYFISKRRFENAYAVYDGIDRVHLFYAQSYVINNGQAYCLEPGVAINTNYYYATEDLSLSGLSADILKQIRLIGYYGFNYPTHSDNNYYMAAQEMIWETITNREVYWVSEENVNGPRINIDYQKNVIKSLVDSHYNKPSFDDDEIVIEVGKTYTLNDDNNVLSKFKIYNSSVENVTINKNSLSITPSNVSESGNIELMSKPYTDKISLVYYRGDNQKLLSSTGVLEPVISSFKIKVVDKPYLKIVKVDENTGRQIYLSGIKFKIRNVDTDEYVCEDATCTYITDDNGIIITNDKFDYGNYELIEIDDVIDGYLWNSDALKFSIDENSNYQESEGKIYLELKFNNKPVTGTLQIVKLGEKPIYNDNLIMYEDYALNNVVFNLYTDDVIYNSDNTIKYNKDEYIGTYKTIDGEITIDNLPLGKYYIKEVSTVDKHILDRDKHCFELKYVDQHTDDVLVKLKLKNYLAKGILEFEKIDNVSGKTLPNTKIAIYNQDNQLIFTDYTNDKGKIVLEGLPIGKYYIKELEAPMGYALTDEIVYFEIKGNDEVVSANMRNNIIDVPSTNKSRDYYSYIISFITLILGIYLYRYEIH